MVVLLLLLVVISLWNVRLSDYHEDYISPRSTNAIKGIFAAIILSSHMKGYVTLDDTLADSSFVMILNHMGQLMVVMYLFYSGFGIVESMKRKADYFASYPKKRILKTLLHFDLAVLAYFVLMTAIGVEYPMVKYITCWIGWSSIGNSNWFIFDILALYSIVYLSHLLMRKQVRRAQMAGVIMLTSLLSVLLWIFLKAADKGSRWVDTLFTFPLGMWYSFYRDKIEFIVRERRRGLWVIMVVVIVFLAWYALFGNDVFGFCACLFALMVVALSTRVRLDNKVLQWLGTQSFAIYIMQRLPMNLFQHWGWNENPYIFAALSIPSALLIAWGFNQFLSVIDKALLRKELVTAKE